MYRRRLVRFVGLVAACLGLLTGSLALVGAASVSQSAALAQGDGINVYLPLALLHIDADSLPSVPTAESPLVGTATSTASTTPTAISTPTSVASVTPAVTPTPNSAPDGPYLLIEDWEDHERGPGCRPTLIDFEVYYFYRDTGVLHVYAMWGGVNRRLEPHDIGYIGCGTRFTGTGGGVSSALTAFDQVPSASAYCKIELLSVAESGDVVVLREDQRIALRPSDGWNATQVREDPYEPGCVVTVTQRVSNLGWQDRSKIEYWGP